MTRAEAVRHLIRHTADNIAGSGTGIREEVSEGVKRKAVEAIRFLYPLAYGRDMDSSDAYSLRLPAVSLSEDGAK